MNKKVNINIITNETMSPIPEWQDESFLVVSVTALSAPASSPLGVGAKFLPSSYSNSISDFGAFKDQIISDSALFKLSETYSEAYCGVNLNGASEDILQSRTMTLVEKNALVLAISFHNAGYYVLADINDDQKTYKEFLNKYNIPTHTSDS